MLRQNVNSYFEFCINYGGFFRNIIETTLMAFKKRDYIDISDP